VSRHVVARAADLGEGGRLIVDVAGRSIGIFRVAGRLYGLRNRCPHAGGELCRGRLLGRLSSPAPGRYEHDLGRPLVRCPWHGWEFDLETGVSVVDARGVRVRPYEVCAVSGADLGGGDGGGGDRGGGDRGGGGGGGDRGGDGDGAYRAETVEVSIDEEYLVVTLGGGRG
jgi:nitrite reductase/ring-hydroxylating ferredoxin subunit